MRLALQASVRWIAFAALAAVGACATGRQRAMPADTEARPARDVPSAFTFDVPAAGDACRNPALDPRDGTRLTLMRSANGRGDYAAPTGRYGAGTGDLVRLVCATGTVVGLVSR